MTTPVAEKPGRITSLDGARGAFLIASVTTSAVLAPRPAQLNHAEWYGVTAYDLIFPLFVTLSGVGLAFAYRNGAPWWVTARRVVVLLVAGLLYTGLVAGDFSLDTYRVTGPLQVYSVLVLVIAVLHRWVHTVRGWALTTTVAAATLTSFLYTWAQQCRTGHLTPGCNPSGTLDTLVLGAHMYRQGELGHDPEGLVAIAGAFVSACVGVTAGHLAVRLRRSPTAAQWLVAWAVAVVLAGALLSLAVEPMKRLWTPSFGLMTGGVGAMIFAVGFLLLDTPAGRGWSAVRARLAWPLVALGRNSLLVYFGSHLAFAMLDRAGGEPSWARRIAETVAVGDLDPRLAFVLVWLAAWWALALVLHRARIYVHA